LTLIDTEREWIYEVKESASKSRNSPFGGWRLKGKAKATIVRGRIAWEDREKSAGQAARVATASR
jgi:dihydroorotase